MKSRYQNPFHGVMSKKTDQELQKILQSSGTYTEEAHLAAACELKKRGIISDEIEQLISKLSIKIKVEQEVSAFEGKLFSKNSLYYWALFVSPLLISPFLVFNIWEVGDRKHIWNVLFLTLLYLTFIIIVSLILPSNIKLLLGFVHILYTIFFVEWTWNKYLPNFEEYRDGQKLTK